VDIYDRVTVTSLLSEGGKQGGRVIGATGINVRTGAFLVFKAKATISCMAQPDRMWYFRTETSGLADMSQPGGSGGWAMAWRAGAEFTKMEASMQQAIAVYYPCQGAGHPRNTWYAANFVDANGKEIPWIDRDGKPVDTVSARYRPSKGQKFLHFGSTVYEYMMPSHIAIDEMVQKGELMLPLYADLTSMPEQERRVIFGVMVGNESKSNATYKNYTAEGFDPERDMLQGYQLLTGGGYGVGTVGKGLWGTSAAYGLTIGGRAIRRSTSGGLIVDWNMRTNLEGLYAAGGVIFGATGHSAAATSGKYAARKAAEYIQKASDVDVDRGQVDKEKARVYAPIKRSDGIDWKELNNGLNKVMQAYCGDPKNDHLLELGLTMLDDLKDEAASSTYAIDPHKLSRILEVMDIIDSAEIVLNACLARKASSRYLSFNRYDYQEVDPPQWRKFLTVKQENEKVNIGELPLDFWGDAKRNYQAHCGL
jgi:succinate dehydrogenase/fumarate reductase flavoprotein subunit